MELSPIVLFVYNRPWHTKQTVEALQKNQLAPESNLIIFSDGSKNETGSNPVQKVRDYIKTIEGFKTIEIIEQDQNQGLANSIINGVTKIINKYGKVIVLEDDLVSSSKFLLFMNQALDWYAKEKKIFSISGYNFQIVPPPNYKYDGYFSYRSMSWSWGTWLDRWEKADWEVKDFDEFIENKSYQKLFNRGGDDLTQTLKSQMRGKISSWSIIWDYTHFRYNTFSLCPVYTKIYNIGFDGTGIHCDNTKVNQQKLKIENVNQFNFSKGINLEDYFITAVKELHKYSYKRKLKNLFNKIIRK